jgi:hypothetical protein
MMKIFVKYFGSAAMLGVLLILTACSKATSTPKQTLPPSASATSQTQIPVATIVPPTLDATLLTTIVPTATLQITGNLTPTTVISGGCPVSVQLRRDNADLILKYNPKTVTVSDWALAAQYFSILNNSSRVLLGSSLAELQKIMTDVESAKVPYEGIAYDLERGAQTPETEQADPVTASKQAADLAHAHGKTLIMVPGMKLMQQNPQYFNGMAANADGWVIQSQKYQGQFQAGPDYRNTILQVITKIKEGNPNIPIWVQISVTPGVGTPLSVETLLAYRNSVINDITGIAIFDLLDPAKPATLKGFLEAVCK